MLHPRLWKLDDDTEMFVHEELGDFDDPAGRDNFRQGDAEALKAAIRRQKQEKRTKESFRQRMKGSAETHNNMVKMQTIANMTGTRFADLDRIFPDQNIFGLPTNLKQFLGVTNKMSPAIEEMLGTEEYEKPAFFYDMRKLLAPPIKEKQKKYKHGETVFHNGIVGLDLVQSIAGGENSDEHVGGEFKANGDAGWLNIVGVDREIMLDTAGGGLYSDALDQLLDWDPKAIVIYYVDERESTTYFKNHRTLYTVAMLLNKLDDVRLREWCLTGKDSAEVMFVNWAFKLMTGSSMDLSWFPRDVDAYVALIDKWSTERANLQALDYERTGMMNETQVRDAKGIIDASCAREEGIPTVKDLLKHDFYELTSKGVGRFFYCRHGVVKAVETKACDERVLKFHEVGAQYIQAVKDNWVRTLLDSLVIQAEGLNHAATYQDRVRERFTELRLPNNKGTDLLESLEVLSNARVDFRAPPVPSTEFTLPREQSAWDVEQSMIFPMASLMSDGHSYGYFTRKLEGLPNRDTWSWKTISFPWAPAFYHLGDNNVNISHGTSRDIDFARYPY